MKITKGILIFLLLHILISCSSDKTKSDFVIDENDKIQKPEPAVNISNKTENDIRKNKNIKLSESKNEEDLPVNDYLTEELKPLRTNFLKINSIKEWTAVDKRRLVKDSLEGIAMYYYINKSLQKIIAIYSTVNEMMEFYFLDNQLSMAIFKSVLTENDNKELICNKYYFKGNHLLQIINSQDCGSPFEDDFIKSEEKRIQGIYAEIKSRLDNGKQN